MNRRAQVRRPDRPGAEPIPARLATTPWTRLRGWTGVRRAEAGGGLWLEPCNAVHTMFMRFPIDAVFLSRDRTVLAIREQVAPWRFLRPVWRARSVLELPAGEARRLGLLVGDQLLLADQARLATA